MSNCLSDAFLAGLDEAASRVFPTSVKKQAASCLVDYLACAFLGSSMLHEQSKVILDALARDGGSAPIIGLSQSASAQTAALVNGMNAHVAELDDGHRYSTVHGGSPIISALLSVASSSGMTGEQFIRGVVMGYEAAHRLASAIQPGHKLKGLHATGTCGTIGAALGIAYALGFSESQKRSVLAAAATEASGLLEMMDNTSTMKPYNVGHAAAGAVDAALVGLAGFSGPLDPLGGKRGFLQLMAQDVDEERLSSGFGGTYCIEMIYRKPYAACRHAHAAIEAAMVAAGKAGIDAACIESVLVETYGLAVKGHDHTQITGVSSAKMSIPYSVAVALVCGKAGYQQFEQNYLENPLVQRLTNAVRVVESPELSALVPAKRGAIATICGQGGTWSARVDYPKGEPENPIASHELDDKFMSLLAAAGRDGDYAGTLLDAAWKVERDLPALLEMLKH